MDLFEPQEQKPRKDKKEKGEGQGQGKQGKPGKHGKPVRKKQENQNSEQHQGQQVPAETNFKKSSGDNENKNKQSNNPNPRRRRKKVQGVQKIQEIKPQPKQQLTIPLIIKTRPNSLSQEEFDQPLQEFIDRIYAEKQSEDDSGKKVITPFQQEDDDGNIEYKLKLIHPSEDRIEHLTSQMKFRIKEGHGEAYYRIGVEDNGRPKGLSSEDMFESLKTICRLAHKIQTNVTILRVSQGMKGLIVELMVRKSFRQGIKLQIRLLLFGEVGSGKSTLLGVLKSGQKDNGKGYCRNAVSTHKHELMSGTTMTKSHHVIGFDSEGMLYSQHSMMSSDTWLQNANKILSFIDVGGHKKAQKQLVSSLCSFFPEYGLWVLSAKSKFSAESSTVSNLQLAKIFNLPLIVVITHMDLADREQEMETIYQTKKALKVLYPDKTPCIVKEMEHAVLFSRITSTEDVIPIFLISNVSGQCIDLLTNFFNLLPSTSELRNNEDMHSEFLISDKYIVDGRIILAGTVIKGNIKTAQILHLGPDQKGTFRAIETMSIECMRVPVKIAQCGQVCTIAIRPFNYAKEWLSKQPNAIRRGMVLIESKSNPKAAYQFLVELTTYGKQEVTITTKYQPVVNTLTTRQICSIVTFPNEKEQMQLPMKLISKKSKSIDSSLKKSANLHRISSTSNVSISQIKPSLSLYKSKQSVDLSDSTDFISEETQSPMFAQKHEKIEKSSKDKSSTTLQPILEKQIAKSKKKKEKQEIKFTSKKNTSLRLRFKYFPEYITVGQKIVINELKLIGKVKQIFY